MQETSHQDATPVKKIFKRKKMATIKGPRVMKVRKEVETEKEEEDEVGHEEAKIGQVEAEQHEGGEQQKNQEGSA